jgi:hypothetical protein
VEKLDEMQVNCYLFLVQQEEEEEEEEGYGSVSGTIANCPFCSGVHAAKQLSPNDAEFACSIHSFLTLYNPHPPCLAALHRDSLFSLTNSQTVLIATQVQLLSLSLSRSLSLCLFLLC